MSLDQPDGFVKHQTVTRDAFLGGRLTVSQPRHGFRAGLDSVLLGASVGRGRAKLLDLGAGVGTAGLVALTHNARLCAVLAEQHPDMLTLAATNARDNGLAERTSFVAVDVAAKGALRHAAGLVDNAHDAVIANPPFFEQGAGTLAGDSARAEARHMDAAALDLWVKTAAGCAAGGGEVIFIFPAGSLSPLLASFSQRFGAISVLPLHSRPNQPASRVLIRGIKGSRAPLNLLPGRVLHEAQGRAFRPEFDAIFRGTAQLDW